MVNIHLNDALSRIASQSYYTQLFKDAFPHSETMAMDEKVGMSLAAFVSAITTSSTKYDRFTVGSEQLAASENNGMILFKSKYNCDECHHVDETTQFSPRFAN